jgi:hypothetical protein
LNTWVWPPEVTVSVPGDVSSVTTKTASAIDCQPSGRYAIS